LRPPLGLLYGPGLRGHGRRDRARACGRRALRPVGDAARCQGSHSRRRLFALARQDRRGEGGMTITIALPSKGRMKDDASAIFERAGMKISAVGNDRSYRGRVEGWEDVEIAFLSASEISREIGNGTVDFGVTGEDLVREDLP